MRLSDFDWAPGWTLYDHEEIAVPFAAGYSTATGAYQVALQPTPSGLVKVYTWPTAPGLSGHQQLLISGLQMAVYAGMPPQEVWESVMRGHNEGE